jgi:hypothetical protein
MWDLAMAEPSMIEARKSQIDHLKGIDDSMIDLRMVCDGSAIRDSPLPIAHC